MAHPAQALAARLLALAAVVAGPMLLAAPVVCVTNGGDVTPPAVPANASASAASAAPAASASAAPSASGRSAAPSETASAALVAPPPVPTSTVATTKTDAGWAACHQSFKAK